MAYDSVFAGLEGGATAGPPTVSASVDAGFGPSPQGSTGPGLASIFHPASGFGLAFWLGVAGMAGLVIIYRSLPG